MKVPYQRNVIMDFVLDELKSILNKFTVKLEYLADVYETSPEQRNSSQMYVICMQEMDTFLSHPTFSEYAIRKANFTKDETLIKACMRYKANIPVEYRDLVVRYEREYVINNYIEYNNYYRRLNGLPDLYDTDEIYLDPEVVIDGIDTTKPISQMTQREISILYLEGQLDVLAKKYPDKKYIQFLKDPKIDYVTSRTVLNYDVLYIPKMTKDPSLVPVFLRYYNESRSYVLNTIYDPVYEMTSDYYPAFMGIIILFITVQRFISYYFDKGIRRDFYDKDIIQYLFESYGLPFYSDISLVYLRKVAKNLNYLLLHKATDKVFMDIFELFGTENINVSKYYLVKDRKKDASGNPEFKYITDPDGNLIDDSDNLYEMYFVQIERDTKNLGLDLTDPARRLDYHMVADADPLWGGPGDMSAFEHEVMASEFNFVETKYIAISSIYELTKLMFETSYLFRYFQDSKEQQKYLPLMAVRYLNTEAEFFNVIVTLFALACKNFNFEGNIPDTTTKTMSVYGFNFDYDMEYINKIIVEHRRLLYSERYREGFLVNKDIIIDRLPEDFETKADFINFWFSQKDIYDTLLKMMWEADNINDWNIYKHIYRQCMVTMYNTDMYRSSDGTLPSTYTEYLRINDDNLYRFVMETTTEELTERMDAILYSLEEYLDGQFDSVFINIPSLSADLIRRFLYYLIDIFKSYTLDLNSMNILYHIDNKWLHNLKLVDDYDMWSVFDVKTILDINELLSGWITDKIVEYLKLKDEDIMTVYDEEFEDISLTEKEEAHDAHFTVGTTLLGYFHDILEYTMSDYKLQDSFKFRDDRLPHMISEILLRDFYKFRDEFLLGDTFNTIGTTTALITDIEGDTDVYNEVSTKIKLRDSIFMYSTED